jgi:hypothetical protein
LCNKVGSCYISVTSVEYSSILFYTVNCIYGPPLRAHDRLPRSVCRARLHTPHTDREYPDGRTLEAGDGEIADQRLARAELSIAVYLDSWHIWEVVRMAEEGVLVLRNMDGSGWT